MQAVAATITSSSPSRSASPSSFAAVHPRSLPPRPTVVPQRAADPLVRAFAAHFATSGHRVMVLCPVAVTQRAASMHVVHGGVEDGERAGTGDGDVGDGARGWAWDIVKDMVV